jgi:hypothetical protein
MTPRAGLDDAEKTKFLTLWAVEPDHSSVKPAVSRCTDCATPAASVDEMYAAKEFSLPLVASLESLLDVTLSAE